MPNDVGQKKIIVDADEEITTVIDHLRYARSNNIVLVVPQRAVILQSVVNLKLLAQEAQKMHKKIVIVTQDEGGITFAQRAGIGAQPFSVEDEIAVAQQPPTVKSQRSDISQHVQNSDIREKRKQKGIGSDVFFAREPFVSADIGDTQMKYESVERRDSGQPTVMNSSQRIVRADTLAQQKNGDRTQDEVYGYPAQMSVKKRNSIDERRVMHDGRGQTVAQRDRMYTTATQKKHIAQEHNTFTQSDHDRLDDEIVQYERALKQSRVQIAASPQLVAQKNSYASDDTQQYHTSKHNHPMQIKRSFYAKEKIGGSDMINVSSPARYLVKSLLWGGVILILIIIMVVILPKTSISVTPKDIVIDDTVEVTARTDQMVFDSDRRIVPARMIERDITFTKSFNATGSGDVSAQKAQGTITIYNAYDDQPQQLVASTRFLSSDGILFRLVKTTTVPGMKEGSPGTVEALVMADKAGTEGNVGPTRFSIPGFSSGPKKEKFYAISDHAMTGGGTGGNGVALVSEDDIARAQKDMEAGMSQYVQEQLSTMIRPESEILLPEAVMSTISRSESSVSAKTMGEQFMYEVVAHVQAIVFVQEDVVAILAKSVSIPEGVGIEDIKMQLSFNDVKLDQENNMIKFSARGSATMVAHVSAKDFKNDIIGKKHDEILPIIKEKYAKTIEKITIKSVVPGAPQFLAERISRFGFMTQISIEPSGMQSVQEK
ncbi:MAG: hypothetical protein WC819_06115 [Parcubacteria group bacterium]|jgi:hypothetical protein